MQCRHLGNQCMGEYDVLRMHMAACQELPAEIDAEQNFILISLFSNTSSRAPGVSLDHGRSRVSAREPASVRERQHFALLSREERVCVRGAKKVSGVQTCSVLDLLSQQNSCPNEHLLCNCCCYCTALNLGNLLFIQ